jgi:3-dehydroquinate dehydratase II
MKKIALVNGPNLNFLGRREPDIYGSKTLKEIEDDLTKIATTLGFELTCFQSNHEGAIIDFLQSIEDTHQGVIINPGALMMNGYGLHDALAGSSLTYIEVHISNIFSRESFRHKSILSAKCVGQITGFGIDSYNLGLQALSSLLS